MPPRRPEQDFWSRRRRLVKAEAQAEAEADRAAKAARDRQAQDLKTDDELLAELDLPDPDTLQPGDNFADFMREAVPERLRRRALRRLWVTNPVLANLDQLVDYGEDYTDAGTVVESMKSAYQVGRGMLRHVQALEEKARNAAALEGQAGCDADVEVSTARHKTDAAPGIGYDDAGGDAPAAEALNPPDDPDLREAGEARQGSEAQPETEPMMRHMRFRFEDAAPTQERT